jgi:replicative DNA helicase
MTETERLELSVVGRLLLDPGRIYDIRLSAADFASTWCAKVYKALDELTIKRDPNEVDALVVSEHTAGKLDPEKLIQASTDFACIDAVLHVHAASVRQAAVARKVRIRAERLSQSTAEGDELLAEAMTAFNDIGADGQQTSSASLSEIQHEVWKQMLDAKSGRVNAVQTGIPAIDSMNCLERGGVMIIAGRPSMGKSAFAQYLARHIAEQGDRILIFSTEMSRVKWGRRFMAAESGVNSTKIANGTTNKTDIEHLKACSEATARLPVWIDDESDRIKTLSRSIREHRQRHKTTLVIVDHIQECIQGREPQRELMELLAGLRNVCRESPKTTLVLVSQLNRGVESRQDKKPLMSDLRESGRLEEVADSVLLCYRPAYYDPSLDSSIMTVGVSKNRDGGLGAINCYWDAANGRVKGIRDASQDE